MGAGAVGMLLGGVVAQRYSRRLVLVVPALVLVPAILLLPSLGYVAMLPVAAAAGLAMEANFSLAIVMGQEYLPARMGLAVGLLNGFCTAVAGLVLYGLGLLGDAAGPEWVLYALALLPLGVAVLALLLPRPAAAPAETRWSLRPVAAPRLRELGSRHEARPHRRACCSTWTACSASPGSRCRARRTR